MKTVSMKRAMEILGITRRAIYYRMKAGELETVKEDGARLIVLTPEMEAKVELAALTHCPHCGKQLALRPL